MAKMKILLVDDEPDFLEVMGTRIEGWGHDLSKAASGKEAVALVKSRKPSLVILDYMMPDMDGIATLKEIRKVDKAVRVIMFTAYPNEKAMDDTERLGISAFIPKMSVYSDAQASLKAAIEMIGKNL